MDTLVKIAELQNELTRYKAAEAHRILSSGFCPDQDDSKHCSCYQEKNERCCGCGYLMPRDLESVLHPGKFKDIYPCAIYRKRS